MISREEAYRLVDAAFDHIEREAKENSDEKRAAQQRAALTIIRDFIDRAGWGDLLQRRLVTFIQGKPEGSPSEARELPKLLEPRRNSRRALQRFLYDLRPLPGSLEIIGSLVVAEEGLEGSHGGGGVFEPENVAGVDKKGGAALKWLKIHIVEMTGYTAGAAGLPETRRLPEDLLQRALGAWRHSVPMQTGKPAKPVTTNTIRLWRTRRGSLAEIFNLEFERGFRDKLANSIDKSKLLARVN
jgi:hypothetical protein